MVYALTSLCRSASPSGSASLNVSTLHMSLRPLVTCLFTPGILATFLLTVVAPQSILAASGKAISPDAQSFYPVRLEDKTAVYLSPSKDSFGTKGDGVADDTAALQKAIDTVADTTHQGIVFIPEGRYRLTHTLYVWPGIRLIGYGAQRPTFV